jgi:hypothetical protein
VRKKGKRADYLLRYTRDFPIAVTEAKAEYKKAADGLQQAKDYAEILKLKFAYATNGREIIEFDFITGIERFVETFPTPAELWSRLRAGEKLTDDTVADRLLTPFNLANGKIPHYYQRIAIDRVVRSILQGRKRVLLTMATGTGKTVVAFQICWKLWSSKWNAKGDPTKKPRIANHVKDVLSRHNLAQAGAELVIKIANAPSEEGRPPRRRTSFASKFCHFFVDAKRFPIYDDAARQVLKLHLRKSVKPHDYKTFCSSINQLKNAVSGCDTRMLDRYLWQTGMYMRWLKNKKKKNPMVNAELLKLFKKPSKVQAAKLDAMLPATLRRVF